MSNDVILADIRKNLAAAIGELDEDTRAVAGGGGFKRLSIEGGVFRKIVNGKEVGTIEDRHMNVIFVKLAHTPFRKYYADAYQKGVKSSPTCWSSDTKTPDADVETPMAKTCADCPMSVKGSNASGQGTACRLSWQTAVVLPNDPSGDIMQLIIPAASCFGKEDSGRWPFRPYVQMLAGNNISVGRVITKMQFDTKSPAPKLLFSPVGAVDLEQLPAIQAQAKTEIAQSMVKLTVFKSEKPTEDVAQPEAPAASGEDAGDVEAAPAEPKLRQGKGKAEPAVAQTADLSAVMAKWAKK